LEGVEFCVLNTDVQALEKSSASIKLQIGKNLTRGLGAGADPEVGRKAVEEDREEIMRMLSGSDMVFVTAGMGGGTGTGGVPVVASIAKSIGALVVGIVTKPFAFEGKRRSKQAEDGIEELRRNVDTLIVIPNQKLLGLVEMSTSFLDGFSLANQVLYNATRGISELIIRHGYINVDFADVRTVMREMGDAIMGSGVGRGEHRATVAAEHAISSPLLEGVSIQGAQGVLVNITGGRSMSLLEVSEATQIIHDAAGDDANIIFGAVLDESMEEEIMVTVIATGFNTRPKFTGLSVNGDLRGVRAPERVEEAPRPRTQRINQSTLNEEVVTSVRPALRETPMAEPAQASSLPRVERMYTPRGTLREKETSRFDQASRESHEQAVANVARLTPKTDTRHVPSGPRDLKDYDQPAYLRRGVQLPPIGDTEETVAVAQETQKAEAQPEVRRDRDDKPAFLRKIMD
jgi:cell division protein FtsZ